MLLDEGGDRVIRIAHGKGGVLIHRLDTGTSEWYAAVPPDQTTMDDFAVAAPRIPAFGGAGGSREIRLAENLRLGWGGSEERCDRGPYEPDGERREANHRDPA